MSDEGYLGWTPELFFETPWLDGAFLSEAPEEGVNSGPAPIGVVTVPMLNGRDVTQRLIGGAKAPEALERQTWSMSMAPSETDYARIQSARAKGYPVHFSLGGRVSDYYRGVVAGDERTLSRPLAAGVVSGVTSMTHPVELLWDGAVDAGAATVTGQTVTVVNAGPGDLEVRYTPVYLVRVEAVPWSVPQTGELVLDMVLTEVFGGDFS